MHPGILRPLAQDDLDRVFESINPISWAWLRGKRVFLTGGTGFIGKWILSTLLEADRRLNLGCRVVVLSRNPAAFADQCPALAGHPAVECWQGDVRAFTDVNHRCDLVIHAATDVASQTAPLELFDICVQGGRRVMDFALTQGAGRVLVVSSGAVYGEQPADMPAVAETYNGAPSSLDPRSAYGEGKRVAEWLASAYAAQYGLDVRIARCFAFVGPYQPLGSHFAIANFIRDAMQHRSIVVNGDGTPLRTYLYASDMTAWLWAIALRASPGSVYNVGGAEAISIGDLAARVTRLLGSNEQVSIRHRREGGLAPVRYVPAVDKAVAELGVPPPLDLDTAILRTAAWHRAAPAQSTASVLTTDHAAIAP